MPAAPLYPSLAGCVAVPQWLQRLLAPQREPTFYFGEVFRELAKSVDPMLFHGAWLKWYFLQKWQNRDFGGSLNITVIFLLGWQYRLLVRNRSFYFNLLNAYKYAQFSLWTMMVLKREI